MDFSDLAKHRYSVRAYKPDAVPDADVEQILQDACLAPTAANRQAFQLIVVHTEGLVRTGPAGDLCVRIAGRELGATRRQELQ
jgi:nitroreductase